MPELPASTYRDRRAQRQADADRRRRGDAGAVVVLGGAAALAAWLWWEHEHGGAAASCQHPAPLPDGLYVECSVPGNPNSCTVWAKKGNVRYGVPSPAQQMRCYGTNPVIHPLPPGGFGNADTNTYVGTVGFIAACSPCISVPH